jgi:tetratricopeptide (TPR) repeat protein
VKLFILLFSISILVANNSLSQIELNKLSNKEMLQEEEKIKKVMNPNEYKKWLKKIKKICTKENEIKNQDPQIIYGSIYGMEVNDCLINYFKEKIIQITFNTETIKFDADNDGLIDIVSYTIKDMQNYPNLNDPTIAMEIKTTNKTFIFNTYFSAYPTILSCGKGCININQIRGGRYGLNLQEYYKFDTKRKHWFLYKRIDDGKIKYLDESFRIDYRVEPKSNFNSFINLCKIEDMQLLNSINDEYLNFYLNKYKLTHTTLTQYNNIAYYLQKAGANEEAVFLLKKIVKKFPNRTVAYYNLGDAYWALGEKDKAIKAYTTYIEQMCNKGLQKKIPKEILNKVKN